jgi:hypothetical protein
VSKATTTIPRSTLSAKKPSCACSDGLSRDAPEALGGGALATTACSVLPDKPLNHAHAIAMMASTAKSRLDESLYM